MYKVVCNIGGKLHSAYVNNIDKFDVEYKVGEWVRPIVDGTSLFVFPKLEDAKRFIDVIKWQINYFGTLEIYTCSVLNPKYTYNRFIRNKLELIFASKNETNEQILLNLENCEDTPSWDSIYAEAVKLHERVE